MRHFLKMTNLILLPLALAACAKPGFVPPAGDTTTFAGAKSLPITGTEANVLPISIGCGMLDGACTTIVICTPGTQQCQTIPNVLVDTGSNGLRLFSSVVGVSLSGVTDATNKQVAECVPYASNNSSWGPVKKADVVLGGERASSVPVQIMDSTFGTVPSDCASPYTDPNSLGFNGILGVGALAADCPDCVSITNNRVYFSCDSSGTCTSTLLAATKQVANPVAYFPVDNNGVIVQLPGVQPTGAVSASGYLVFGIGTQTDNTPPDGVTVFRAQIDGLAAFFTTQFNGKTYPSALDTGSSALWFPGPSSLPDCSDAPDWYCPTSSQTLSATMQGAAGSPSLGVTFQLINADAALSDGNPNFVFNDIGGPIDGIFLWGIPFFLGRTVYIGMNSASSSLGAGPYYAF